MSTRHLDPPVRPKWLPRLAPAQKATAMLSDYLASRVGCANASESNACRKMLAALGSVRADGNPAGVELAIRKGTEFGSVLIYFHIPGVGQIAWLPSLVTQSRDRLAHIIRETGPDGLRFTSKPDPIPASAFGSLDDSPKRRNIPETVQTRLIPGKRV